MMDQTVTYWIEKGGAFAIISLLIYFYRRDWTTLTEYWQQQNTLLMEIVRTNTVELGKMQESLKLMHIESIASAEAVRTRIHEIAGPIQGISAGMALLLVDHGKNIRLGIDHGPS